MWPKKNTDYNKTNTIGNYVRNMLISHYVAQTSKGTFFPIPNMTDRNYFNNTATHADSIDSFGTLIWASNSHQVTVQPSLSVDARFLDATMHPTDIVTGTWKGRASWGSSWPTMTDPWPPDWPRLWLRCWWWVVLHSLLSCKIQSKIQKHTQQTTEIKIFF